MREAIIEYVDELLEYDLALWVFMIVTYTLVAFLTVFVLSEHATNTSEAESLARALKWPIYAAVAIVFGRPLATMLGRRALDRYRQRGIDG